MKRLICLLICLVMLPVFSACSFAEGGETKEISILFIGNSLTLDAISYVPYILRTCWPEISFRIYLWYNGGDTLGEQYVKFLDNIPCEIFSVAENTAEWTNEEETRTMTDVLSSYVFDIVCLQEYFTPKVSYTESDLEDWKNCWDFVMNHYTAPNYPEFITLFHAPARENMEEQYEKLRQGNTLILEKTKASDMIPAGTALYLALRTELDALGDEGHLSVDGIHAQEGLPCLIQAYTAVCWILDRMGLEPSVNGCPVRITEELLETLNIPGESVGSGVLTGNEEENAQVQELATIAYTVYGRKFVDDAVALK